MYFMPLDLPHTRGDETLGVNTGGLGTLIASMASLISYKLYANQPGAEKGKYMLTFTAYNVAGFVLLLGVSLLCGWA